MPSRRKPNIARADLFAPKVVGTEGEQVRPSLGNQGRALTSLASDFFSPPSLPDATTSILQHVNRGPMRSVSTKQLIPILPKKELRTSKGISVPKLDPLLGKYEEYITYIHNVFEKEIGSLPAHISQAHTELQREMLRSLKDEKKKTISGSTRAKTLLSQHSMIDYPSTEHHYNHIKVTGVAKKKFVFHSKWNIDSAQGGFLKKQMWWKNPQYVISCSSTTTLRVTILQQNEQNSIGFHLFPVDQMQRVIDLPSQVYSSEFQQTSKLQEIIALEDLNRSHYVLIVCGEIPGAFKLTIEGKTEIRVTNPVEWNEWQILDSWDSTSAGGCRNSSYHSENPQYLLQSKSKANSECVASLHYDGVPDTEDELGIYIIYATKLDSQTKRISSDCMKVKAKAEFKSISQGFVSFTLEPLEYAIIVPCTFDRGILANFELAIFSTERMAMKRLKSPNCTELQGEWTRESAGGCMNHPTWIDNPQYLLQVQESCSIHLAQTNTQHSIGFYVLPSDGKRILAADSSQVLYKTNFGDADSVSLDIAVEDGETSFIIIPCTFKPHFIGKFTMSLSNKNKSPIAISEVPNPWHLRILAGKWSKDTAGGCFNHATWRNNVQYQAQFLEDTKVTIIVEQEDIEAHSLGCYVFLQEDGQLQWNDVLPDDVIAKAKFKKDYSTHCSFNAEAGQYYNILPCTYFSNIHQSFRLRIYAEIEEMEIFSVENPSLDPGRCCKGSWNQSNCGGSMNNETWPNNPHYLIYTDDTEVQTISIVLSRQTADFAIGFCITPADQYGLPDVQSIDDIIGKVEYQKEKDVFLTISLPGSSRPYVVTPSCFEAGKKGEFMLQIFAEEEANVMLMPWTSTVFFEESDEDIPLSPIEEEEWKREMEEGFAPTSFRDWEGEVTPKPPYSSYGSLFDDFEQQELYSDARATHKALGLDNDDENEMDNAAALNRIGQLNMRISCLEEDQEEYEEERTKLQSTIESLESAKKSLKREVDAMQSKSAKESSKLLLEKENKHTVIIEQTIQKYELQLNVEEGKKEIIKKELSIAESKAKELSNALENAHNNHNMMQKEIFHITEIQKEAEVCVKEKEVQLERSVATCLQLQQKLDIMQDRLNTLMKEKEEIGGRLAQVKKEKRTVTHEKESLEEKNQSLAKEIQLFREKLDLTANQLTETEESMLNKQKTEEELQEVLHKNKNMLNAAQLQVQALQAIEQELRGQVEQKERKYKSEQIEREKEIALKGEALKALEEEKLSSLRVKSKLEATIQLVASLQSDIEFRDKNMVEMQRKITRNANESLEVEASRTVLQSKLVLLQQELDRALASSEHVLMSNTSHEKLRQEQIKVLEIEISSLQQENIGLSRQCDELKTKHDLFYSRIMRDLETSEQRVLQQDKEIHEILKTSEKLEKENATLLETIYTFKSQKNSHPPIPARNRENQKAGAAIPPIGVIPFPPSLGAPTPPLLKPKKQKKDGTFKAHIKSSKKKSILSAIRGGVDLRAAEPEKPSESIKKSWIPFDVDKIVQRRHAMEDQDENDDENWDDDEEDSVWD